MSEMKCPYGVLTFRGSPPKLVYVVHKLIIDEKYRMKNAIHPNVRRWIKEYYVDYNEEGDDKTVYLILS
jgi:hypothetical protein